MSSKISTDRTIDGADIIEADTINIFEKLEINGATGNAKQVLRLKADGSENLEYSNLETLTFTGSSTDVYNGIDARTINIPSAITSAGNPLVINSGVISFNGNVSTITASGDITANGNIVGDGNTDISSVRNIGATTLTTTTSVGTATITASGNINANGNIVGDDATNITNINNITAGGDITATGDFNANGNISGDNATNISGIDNVGSVSLTTSGNINANGNIVGDGATIISGLIESQQITNKSKIFGVYSDDALSSQVLTFDGTSNNIQGNGSTAISNMANISGTTFSFGDIVWDGNQLLVGSGPAIHKTSGIDMNEKAISDAKSITYKDTATNTFAGGSASNKVVFSHCDFSGATNTQADIPSSISGNKTFTGTITADTTFTAKDEVLLSQTAGNVEIGNNSQGTFLRPLLTTHSQIVQKFPIITGDELKGTGVSGRMSHQTRNHIENRSYHSPYEDSDYFTSGLPGYQYDSKDKLTGDSNHTPYRVIKLHPTDWCPNEDSTFNDIAIEDDQSYPTTGNTTFGGLMNRHSTIIEVWKYVDIPEGFKFKAIFLKVYSTTAGTSATAENVKVFKRHIGQHFNDAKYSKKILDSLTSTSLTDEIPLYVGDDGAGGTLSITEHDKVNEYDNSMAIMVNMDSLTQVLSGGYIICEPVDYTAMFYNIKVITSTTPPETLSVRIIDEYTPNTELSSISITASGTQYLTIPYTYGCIRRFFIKFMDIAGTSLSISSIVDCEIGTTLSANNSNNYFVVVNQTPTFTIGFP